MEHRYLGRSGLKVSEICYGNWITHGSQIENETATKCVHAALEAGITSFDTADVYANTVAESVLGAALAGQRRESLEIFTKVYWPTGPKGPNDCGLSRKHIMESINGSLKRLGTDYVDLYQAHRWDSETPLEETLQALVDIVRAGKALYVGLSRYPLAAARFAFRYLAQRDVPCLLFQDRYNLFDREPDTSGILTLNAEAGAGFVAFSPLAQGC